jgi:hypothetical protein
MRVPGAPHHASGGVQTRDPGFLESWALDQQRSTSQLLVLRSIPGTTQLLPHALAHLPESHDALRG